MKTLTRNHIHSEKSAPTIQNNELEEQSLPLLRNTHKSQSRMVEFMNMTMNSVTNPLKITNISKPSKPSITIMPLTREKIRVGQRGWRFNESKQFTKGYRSSNSSPINKDRNESNRSQHYVQFFTMMAFMYNKSKRNNYKLEVFIDELVIYFKTHKERQYQRDLQEIVNFSAAIKKGLLQSTEKLPYQLIRNCDGQLSKLFYNICYEIYLYRHNSFTLLQLGIIHRDIQYYSRRLGMLTLTAVSCMDMGRVCLDFFEFQKAIEHYSQALNLSVYTGDKYREEASIDKLGLCQYYRGDMMTAQYYHSSMSKLSAYNKTKIRQHYSNDKQIKKILDQKTKEKSHEQQIKEQFFKNNKENTDYNFETSVKDNEYIQKNYDTFRTNLKEMIKVNSLRRKVPMIKINLQKVRKIGDKKYQGKEYFVPKASKFHNYSNDRSQDEFMLTHRSYNRNNVAFQSNKIDKQCKIIDQIINFFLSDSKKSGKVINQERESCLSDDNE